MDKDVRYYDGSSLLKPLSDFTDVAIDQVNFVAVSLVSLVLAGVYRTHVGPDTHSASTRHLVQILLGLPLAYFCHGRHLMHVVLQSVVCYAIMKHVRAGVMEKLVMVFAMGYLCIVHMCRQYYDYGSFVVDITGPLMVNVERLTSLAFGLKDGRVRDRDKLTPFRRKYALESLPGVLEYTSYVFSFHNFLCGPFAFYTDYAAFIDGSNYQQVTKQDISNGNTVKGTVSAPSPMNWSFYTKVATTLSCAACTKFIHPHVGVRFMSTRQYGEYNFVQKLLYMILCTTITRQKYYLAWKLSEAVNMNAGFGFSGYDDNGRAKWDLLDNAKIRKIEFSSNLKVMIENWNITTTVWLRYVVYERMRSQLVVFLLSAFWHGFYGGYYIMFLTASLFVHTGRIIRRNVRPLFQGSSRMRALYEVITWCVKTVALAYMSFPFVMLDFWASVQVLREMYFFMHIAAVLTIVLFSFVRLAPSQSKSATTPSSTAPHSATTPTSNGGSTTTPTSNGGSTTTPTSNGGSTTTPTSYGGSTTTPTSNGGDLRETKKEL